MRAVKRMMIKNVDCVSPNDTLDKVALKMRNGNIGIVPVCDEREVLGVITERDIVVRVLAIGKNPLQIQASQIMSSDVVFCFEDQDIEEAVEIMQGQQLKRLVVIDRERNLAGILSYDDIVAQLDTMIESETINDIREADERDLRKLFIYGLAALGIGYFLSTRPEEARA